MDDAREFSHLAELVRRRAGIALTPDKAQAIARRLAPVAHVFGYRNSATLLAELAHPHEELAQAVTEAITTQDTSFFRDPAVFDYVASDIIPSLIAARADRKRLRIWCAGCATGQEAYSLAMLLAEAELDTQVWTINLIATDLSSRALARARDGIYSDYEIEQGLSPDLRARYFTEDGESWRASATLRRALVFRTFNLLDHFGWLGELDLVFCRNVLFYFEPTERAAVLEKLHHVLAADGRLVLGSAESNSDAARPFKPAPGPRGIFLR